MKTNLESITWKGGRGRFETLAKSSQLKRGYIYFVGDYSGGELGGLEQSKSGVIYVATSERSYVTFGTFDLKDIEKRITEIEQRLEDLGGNVDELINEVVTLDEEVVTLGGKVSEIGSKVSTIEEEVEKNASDIASLKTSVTGKVDKVDGKGLSTNDYTTTEKNKLANLSGADSEIVKNGGGITTAGTGLTKSGNTLNHSNAITAQTTSKFVSIKVDAQGHITAIGDELTALTTTEITEILV